MADIFNEQTKTLIELEQEADNILKKNNSTLDTSTTTVAGNIKQLMVFTRAENTSHYNKMYSELLLATATGENLDNNADNFGYVKRLSGEYTIQEATITFSSPAVIYGLDQIAQEIFTIQDNNNNNYKLQNTQQINSAGSYTFSFRAESKGVIKSEIGTIINSITKVPSITNIVNSSNPITIGSLYEEDPSYRSRIYRTRQIKSQLMEDSIESQLLALENVNDVLIYHNRSSSVVNGIPDRTVYVVVEGGDSDEIANVLAINSIVTPYHGSIIKYVANANGDFIQVQYDVVATESIYCKFSLKSNSIISNDSLNALKNKFISFLVDNKIFNIGKSTNSFILTTQLKNAIDILKIDCYAYDLQISKNNTNWFQELTPTLLKNKFDIIASNILITIA
jgi:hypothetical protein